jgi:crotonobetainyl-CoA:carnitine CoA-transferase CaiB-like acyl-CoA transferase
LHVAERQMLIHVGHLQADYVPLLASPIRMSATPPGIRFAPPVLGQHTDEVLAQLLALDAEQIRQLRTEKAI